MSCASMRGNGYTVDSEELMKIENMCKELRQERDMLRETLLQEKSKSAELILGLESDAKAASEARHKDKNYIYKLERELRICSQKIGYLQEQLNLRTVEADCMSEHVHRLELKLADVEKLQEKFRLLNEELVQSNSERSILTQELKHREKELQNYSLHVEDLETAISTIALESQCEIESMKIDMDVLEQRCFEAESFSQRAALYKARFHQLLGESEFKFEEAQKRISILEKENEELKDKLVTFERCADVEHLDHWSKLIKRMSAHRYSGLHQDFLVKLREELLLLKEKGIYEEVLDGFLSKLATVTAWDEEMEKMLKQIHEYEATIEILKEDLREEKQKAKEEAEDLIQAMAELRYQMTDMIEEEHNRRTCVEQASLQRIQDLEAQLRKEHNITLGRSKEADDLVKRRLAELTNSKIATVGLRGSKGVEMLPGTHSCNCVYCPTSNSLSDCCSETCDDICNAGSHRPALIEWHPDAAPVQARNESISSAAMTNVLEDSL